MKKRLLTIVLALAATLCLCFGISACGKTGFSVEGTYYLVERDEYDMKTYFILKGGKWTDEDGVSGDYAISGEKITLYTDLFGEKVEFTSGTLKDGVLTLEAIYGDKVFAQEGAWSKASGSNGGSGSQTPSVQEYTVTYDANGGEFASGDSTYTQTVKEGNKLTAPTSPTRKNYTFAGWAKSKNGSDMWKFDEDTVSSGITLWATWSQESAVILSVEGASIDGREIFMLVDHTTGEVSLSGMVVCSDDSIWRLYSDPEGQREIPTKMVTNLNNGDNEYYIVVNSQNQAQVNVYTLTVHRSYLVTVSYYDGESLLETTETYTGDTFNASYTPDITGYTFNGWEKGGSAFTSAVLWAPLSLYADKTANTYKVTLDVNKGDALSETEKTLTYDKTYSLPVPKRTGYSFTGWYAGSAQLTNASGSSLAAWHYASEKQLTAHWEANNYAVTLKQSDSEAGTVSGGGDHAYDSQVTIKATTNNGYNFLGWYDKNDELVSDKAQYTFKMGFAVSYTAKWDYYTVTTTVNNSAMGTVSHYDDTKVSAGTKITITAVSYCAYTFIGWFDGIGNRLTEELDYSYTMERNNVIFEARWELKDEMMNFIFSSSATTCTITGILDKTVTEIRVPDYVTTISLGAFSGCYAVTDITIPFVGGSAKKATDMYQYPFGYIFGTSEFVGSTAITEYYYGNSTATTTNTTYYLPGSLRKATVLGGHLLYGAFYNCNSLTSISVPNSITSIGDCAFYNCNDLRNIIIPDGVASIGSKAFYKCSELTEIIIPDTVKSIGSGAFSGCGQITSITLPFIGDSIKNSNSTYQYPFGYIFGTNSYDGATATRQYYYGSSLNNTTYSTYYIPSCLENVIVTSNAILYGAFYGCQNILSITIGENVSSVESGAFIGCTNLTDVYWNAIKCTKTGGQGSPIFRSLNVKTVVLGEKVQSVPDFAFSECKQLEEVYISKSITSIGVCAFSGCSNVIAVHIYDLVAWCNISFGRAVNGIYDSNPLTYAQKFYLNEQPLTEFVIPVDIDEIGAGMFYGCTIFTSVTVPDSVKSIGECAFRGCNAEIIWGDNPSVKIFESEAFKEYLGTSIIIPDSVTSIGSYAFNGCDELRCVSIGKGVTSIGIYAFAICPKLEKVIWNAIKCEKAGSISNGEWQSIFADDSNFKTVIIGEDVISIPDGAFSNRWAGAGDPLVVYYEKTQMEWQKIEIGTSNSRLTSSTTIYFYSKAMPSQVQWESHKNWWHYDDETGEIAIWEKSE